MTVNTGDNRWATSNFIVAPTIAQGAGYTTIAAALTAASSGNTIFIKPGTYTENLTLKAGVNLCSFNSESDAGQVTIAGTLTATFTGTATISGIRLQTNSANLLAVTGSAATIINLRECYLNCTNNTGISHTSSNAGSQINLYYCFGDLGTTGIAFIVSTSTGTFNCFYSRINNSGNSVTVSSTSASAMSVHYTTLLFALSTSSTGTWNGFEARFFTVAINTACLTTAGTGSGGFIKCAFDSGTASCVSIGSGTTVDLIDCTFHSTNTNVITGAGSLRYNAMTFSGTDSTNAINPTATVANIIRPGISLSAQQPCFQVNLSGTTAALTGDNTTATVTFATTVFDQNTNFSSTTFTAPFTGRYLLTTQVLLGSLAAGHTAGFIQIVTTSRTYLASFNPIALATPGTQATVKVEAICDMTATDTAIVQINVSGGAKAVTAVKASATDPRTWFCGKLLC